MRTVRLLCGAEGVKAVNVLRRSKKAVVKKDAMKNRVNAVRPIFLGNIA